jgi:N-acetylglucosamine-6-phosphate deacetylase
MNNKLIFTGGVVITPQQEIKADVVVEGSKVMEIGTGLAAKGGAQIIDCSGMYIGPGLVDIHVHGGAGNDFVTTNPEEISKGAEYHLSQGTTSIVPTALSIPFEELDGSIEAAKKAAKICKADILGYHVEGIYLDKTYRGGHLQEHLRTPEPAQYMPIIRKHGDFIREWTLAPELSGAIELIHACRKAGIVTSAGHTQASYEKMLEAIDAGLSHSTHLICVMGTICFAPLRGSTGKGYAPGVVETVLLRDELTTEVIADGFHLHPALIKLAIKCKGIGGVCLVSDSMKGVGLPDGEYVIGGQNCLVQGGIAIIKDRPEVIASSVTPLIGMLRFTHNAVGVPLNEAWTMASLTPAKIIGVDDVKGTLTPGKDADILILRKDLSIHSIYTRGKRII